jgi:hypothetical protein
MRPRRSCRGGAPQCPSSALASAPHLHLVHRQLAAQGRLVAEGLVCVLDGAVEQGLLLRRHVSGRTAGTRVGLCAPAGSVARPRDTGWLLTSGVKRRWSAASTSAYLPQLISSLVNLRRHRHRAEPTACQG